MSKVNNEVNEFRMPVSPLGIWVCAKANKKAGMAFPNKPVTSRGQKWPLILLKFLKLIGKRTKAAIAILKEATSVLLKKTRAFFISINELPQVNARSPKTTH